MFAPQPLWDKKEEDVRKIKRMFYFKSELWYNFLSLTRIHKLPSMPMRFENINEFLLICTTVLDDQSPVDLHKRLELLVNSNVPISLMYGSLESLITKSSIRKLNEKLGICSEDIVYIDPTKDDTNRLQTDKKINSYVIENGGHFAHANFYNFSNKIIENLLNYHE